MMATVNPILMVKNRRKNQKKTQQKHSMCIEKIGRKCSTRMKDHSAKISNIASRMKEETLNGLKMRTTLEKQRIYDVNGIQCEQKQQE